MSNRNRNEFQVIWSMVHRAMDLTTVVVCNLIKLPSHEEIRSLPMKCQWLHEEAQCSTWWYVHYGVPTSKAAFMSMLLAPPEEGEFHSNAEGMAKSG